jgi:TetR/AcrR family transcriptional regulator, transcriptional repressor for nem operon
MGAKSDTKTRLLEATYSLMISKGYPATSIDDICERAGVSKGSVYHFFKSKEQLALAMLEFHMAGAKDEIEQGLDLAGCDGPERAIRYVKHVEERAEDIWREGCLIGSFALELAETNPEVRQRVSAIFRGMTDDFEQLFTPLCEAHPGPDTPPARELAEQFLMVIEGGVVLSRAHQDRRKVPQALRCFRRYLESLQRNFLN